MNTVIMPFSLREAAATVCWRRISSHSLLSSSIHSHRCLAVCASPCRFFSTTRRPTATEVQEALTTLGVTLEMSERQWKSKYRSLVKEHHPDAGGNEALMTKITVAYNILSTLTPREKEEFSQWFRSAAGGYTRDNRASRRSSSRSPADEKPKYAYASPYGQYYQDAEPGRAESQGPSKPRDENHPYAQKRHQQEAFWSYYAKRSTTHNGNFRTTGERSGVPPRSPFSTNYFGMSHYQRARFMQSRSLILRGLAVYLFIISLGLLLFRMVRERKEAHDWRVQESTSRHERMLDLMQSPYFYHRNNGIMDSSQSMPNEFLRLIDGEALQRVIQSGYQRVDEGRGGGPLQDLRYPASPSIHTELMPGLELYEPAVQLE